MSINVINGIGKPRLVDSIEVDSTKTISSVSESGLSITLDNVTDVVGHYLKTKNSNDDDIYAKALSVNGSVITVDAWVDGVNTGSQIPATGSLYVLGTAYDFPNSESLTEEINEDVYFKKLKTGVIKKNVKGFYYKATVSYERSTPIYVLNSIATLLNLKTDFVFIPRRDQPLAAYSVHFTEGFVFRYLQKAFHQGNKGLVISLSGASRMSTISLPTVSDEVTS